MFKDLDAGQTRSFEPSAPEQAGNVNSPFCYKYRHHSMWGGTVLLDNPTYDGQDAIETIPLYRLPEGFVLVPIEPDRKRLDAGLAAYEDSISYKMYDCYLAMTKPMNVPPPSTQEVNK